MFRHVYIMKEKSTQSERFLALTCQLIMSEVKVSDVRGFESVRCSRVLTVKVFDHRIIANLPYDETEIVEFLKTYEIWVFMKKTEGKILELFQVRLKNGEFAVE